MSNLAFYMIWAEFWRIAFGLPPLPAPPKQ